ncbi:hypothetical protein SAMN05216215_103737 [Saccharopolyspora shandongensis]|uniref:Uncharacterized protein n=1 Tax=Saccharopolyspora shandongensis TaxID=418495 RepID=A0A1H3NBP2_9PSEU|nr:hypothetical protein SAMN05216215_103737 [Saccharopolyspora shandongensis]
MARLARASSNQSAHHSHTLPDTLYSPKPLGWNDQGAEWVELPNSDP